MSAQSQLIFPDETGEKITLYGENTTSGFGFRIESGELRYYVEAATNKHGFHVGGAQKAAVDQYGVVAPGLFVGDRWHGWTWDSATNGEHLRSYQQKWQFMHTPGTTPGTKIAEINSVGVWHGGDYLVKKTHSDYFVINGSDNSNSKHFYVDGVNNNNGLFFNVLEARRQNLTKIFQLKGYISHGDGDAHAKMFVNVGTEGFNECTQWADYGDGQVNLLCHGPMSSTHFDDNNRSQMVAGTMAPVDPELAGRLIDAVRPVTFARNFRSSKASSDNPEGFVRPERDPIRTIGFDVIDAATPLADRLLGPEEGGYNVGGMLAVAIAEIKQLRARVAALEGGVTP